MILMKANKTMKKITLITLIALIVMPAIAPAALAELTTDVNNDQIDINLNYNGSTVIVNGDTDAGSDVVIKITGDEEQEKLKTKDKIAGVFWMNTDEENFSSIPSFYYLRSTTDPKAILSPEELASNGIGYEALAHNGKIEPPPSPDLGVRLFSDFFKYKEDQMKYSQAVGGIETSTTGSVLHYETVFDWPYQAKPGTYQVTVYSVKDGRIIDTTTGEVRVEEAGVVKTLSDLAKDNGGLYGLLAIGVAVTAGFGVGVVFRKGGGAH
jgi:uncharacterized protein (TIGR02186 family)